MKTAIALRHIHFEDVGTLAPVLSEAGYSLTYIDPTVQTLQVEQVMQADLLIVLGGPIGAYDEKPYPFLKAELELVRQRVESGKPLLGICLGAQLIARAMNAKVYPMGVKEIGFSPLTLTAEGQQSPLAELGDVPVLHWHGDQFDIPQGAVLLAKTDICAHQAFAVDHRILGLQCHLEADPARIEQWLVGHANEVGQTGLDPIALRSAAAELGERLTQAAARVMRAWLANLK